MLALKGRYETDRRECYGMSGRFGKNLSDELVAADTWLVRNCMGIAGRSGYAIVLLQDKNIRTTARNRRSP